LKLPLKFGYECELGVRIRDKFEQEIELGAQNMRELGMKGHQ